MQKNSWEISDAFWEVARPLIPHKERDSNRTYKRKPGGGRPPIDPRKALEAIFFVLRTGIRWKALPKEYGASSAIHRYFKFWCERGVFRALRTAGLEKYDEAQDINWTWLSNYLCVSKATSVQTMAANAPDLNPYARPQRRRPAVDNGSHEKPA